MNKIYATLCEEFEDAIIKFGVDAALEYFATPKELHHLWDELKAKEIINRAPKGE